MECLGCLATTHSNMHLRVFVCSFEKFVSRKAAVCIDLAACEVGMQAAHAPRSWLWADLRMFPGRTAVRRAHWRELGAVILEIETIKRARLNRMCLPFRIHALWNLLPVATTQPQTASMLQRRRRGAIYATEKAPRPMAPFEIHHSYRQGRMYQDREDRTERTRCDRQALD